VAKLIAIVGTTGVGKTSLARALAGAAAKVAR
jgi:tRNA A37 N6-isopentenylltransferase MiaA